MKPEQRIEENKMGLMPVGRLLASMSWPAILSMTINSLYNIIDSVFVSDICEDALTAVTFVFPINMLMLSFGIGTAVGVNSLIARRLGARRVDEAQSAANHGLRLAFFNWILFALIGIFLSKSFMNAYSDIPYIIENGITYMQITTIGSIFIMIAIMIEKELQAMGNMLLPMISSILGAVVNIFLDWVLIFGHLGAPEMGVAGAAVATVIGQLCSMIFCIIVLFKVDKFYKIKIRGFKFNKQILKDIYVVGLPGIVMQSIGSVMQFGINAILAANETAVAVFGAYFRLQSFVFMPVFGMNQGAMPIMGYNYGAGNRHRLMTTFKLGIAAAFIYMSLGLVVFQIFPGQLLDIFHASDAMKEIGIPALKSISFCFVPAAFGIMMSAMFQATGHGTISMFASMIRQLVGILPIAYLMMKLYGLDMVWYAFPIAEIMGLIFSVTMLTRIYKKDIRNLSEIGN